MNKKIISLALGTVIVAGILSGCGAKTAATSTSAATTAAATTAAATTAAATTKAATTATTAKVDATTTASIVNDQAAFLKAVSKDGTWIICTLKDMTIDKEIVLEGDFKNGKKNADGTDAIQRKLAPYTQDADKKVTARFSIKAPKLTIKSANARLQSGTFIGDVYVDVKDFQLVDATVQGNVIFASEDIKKSFKMDATSKITGTQEVKK